MLPTPLMSIREFPSIAGPTLGVNLLGIIVFRLRCPGLLETSKFTAPATPASTCLMDTPEGAPCADSWHRSLGTPGGAMMVSAIGCSFRSRVAGHEVNFFFLELAVQTMKNLHPHWQSQSWCLGNAAPVGVALQVLLKPIFKDVDNVSDKALEPGL